MQPVNSSLNPPPPGAPPLANATIPLPPPSSPAAPAAFPFTFPTTPSANISQFTASNCAAPMTSSFSAHMSAFQGLDPSILVTMASMLMPGGVPNFNVPQPPEPRQAGQTPVSVPQSMWKEHRTNEGRIFWHNTKTGKSTWDKPDELKTDLEKVLATSTNWREYPGGDGKTYWHNLESKQSEWDTPQEVKEIQARMEALEKEDWLGRQFEGKVQAKAAFRAFLERRGIGHKAKWEDVGKIIQADKKWPAFDQFLTPGERKHVFNELVNQLQKKHREGQRVKKAAARDALSEFLTKWRQGDGCSPMLPDVTYEDFVQKANGESWFHLLDAADKAEAFEEIAQLSADEACKRPSRTKIEELLQFFQDVGEGELPLETPAEGVIEFVKASFEEGWLASMPAITILNTWQRHMLEQADFIRNKLKREAYRRERKNRGSFKALLQDAEAEGLLDAKSEWADFLNGPIPKKRRDESSDASASLGGVEIDKILEKVQIRVREWVEVEPTKPSEASDSFDSRSADAVKNDKGLDEMVNSRVCLDARYLRMFLQGGSTAKEIFEDFVYKLWDIYEEIRPVIKKYLSSQGCLSQILCAPQLPNAEKFIEVIEADREIAIDQDLWQAAKRPGVLRPLILSLAKKLRRSVAEEPLGAKGDNNKDLLDAASMQ